MKKLIGFICLSVILVLGYFHFKEKNKQASQEVNVVIFDPIKSFDPAVTFTDDSLKVMGQALETLYQYHYLKRPFEAIPLLARDLPEISEDGRTYTIRIRENIFYHNHKGYLGKNRKVIAQDFVWQIKRLAYAPINSPGTWLFEGKIKGFNKFSKTVGNDYQKFLTVDLEGVRAIDEHTLEIELVRPEPNLLYFLAMTFTSPTPFELIKKFDNKLDSILVGTGPFYIEKMNDKGYYMKAFERFHEEYYPSSGDRYANTEDLLLFSKKRLPFLKRLNFLIFNDEDLAWQAFREGTIDIINVPKAHLNDVASSNSKLMSEFNEKGIQVKHFSRQTTRWIGFNMNDPIIGANKNLRLAIAHAIDTEKYVEVITNNTNLKANSIFNPSISGYRPDHTLKYSFDLSKAKNFFKESGYKPGQLTLTYSTRGKLQIHFEEAEFLKKSLSKLGIKLLIQPLEFSEFIKKGRSGKLQMWTDNWIYDYPDAENLLQLLITRNHPGINKSGFSNIKVDDLYERLSRTLDKEKRYNIMYEIENIVEEELPWVMLMYESTYMAQNSNIKNFRKSFFIRNHYKYISK